jgi:Protein of unknown function (DUF1524)
VPQGLKEVNLKEFGVSSQKEGQGYAFRLGNLALMPWGKNSTMSDRLWASVPPGKHYEPKKIAFANSDWLLFNALGDDKKYGEGGASNATIKEYGLDEAPEWNVEAFKKRQVALESIAAKLWPLLPSRPVTVVKTGSAASEK